MSEWVDIPMAVAHGDSGPLALSHSSDTELINLMLRESPPGSRSPYFVTTTPALKGGTGNAPTTGTIYGLGYQSDDGVLFAVQGRSVYYSTDFGGSWSLLANNTMTVSKFCRLVDAGNPAGDGLMVAVNGTDARVLSTSACTAASIEGFLDAVHQDGITLYAKTDTNSLYAGDVDDPATIGALNFTTVDADSGVILGLAKARREVYAIKATSTEHYFNAGGSGFPFQRGSPGFIHKGAWRGLVSSDYSRTIVSRDDAIFWIGEDRRAYMMQGYQPRVISTLWVEEHIRLYGEGALLFGNVYMANGSVCYVVSGLVENSLKTALVYDSKTGFWHKRYSPLDVKITHIVGISNEASGFNSFFPESPQTYVVAVGDSGNSGIYWLSVEDTNDQGTSTPTTRVMTLPQFVPAAGRRVEMYELELEMNKVTATGTVTLTWSDDNGATWTSGVTNDMTGDRVRFHRLGSFYRRIFRLTFAIDSALEITGVRGRIDAGAA